MIVYRIRVDVGNGNRDQIPVWFSRRDADRAMAELELSYAGDSFRSAVISEHGDEEVAHLDGFYRMPDEHVSKVLDRYIAHTPGRNTITAALAKRGVHIHLVLDRIVGEELRDALVDDLEGLEIGVLTEVIALKLMEAENA
jgi:hypothetical protein